MLLINNIIWFNNPNKYFARSSKLIHQDLSHKHYATINLMSDNLSFTRNLVKGRIAETIFAQMFRDTGQYTVLEFGYEKVMPQLVNGNYHHDDPVIESLRVVPDFAVINQESKEVRLIEVKYRQALNHKNVLECARKMHASWNPSYLFIATLDGFYFDEISKIIIEKEVYLSSFLFQVIFKKSICRF